MRFWLLSFFLLKIRNDERKTFLLRFRFSFLLFEKKERKKEREGEKGEGKERGIGHALVLNKQNRRSKPNNLILQPKMLKVPTF